MLDNDLPSNVNTVPAEPVIEPTEDVSDFENVITSSDDVETQALADEAAGLDSVQESLEAYRSLLEEAGTKGITHQSAAFLKVGLQQVDSVLGYKSQNTSLESFNTSNLRDTLRHVVISQESVSERFEELGDKAIEFIKKLLEHLNNLFVRYANGSRNTQLKTEYLLNNISKFPAYPGGKMSGVIDAPPVGVRSTLDKIAEKIKTRGESDSQSGKITINNADRLFANGVNTYNNVDAERRYLVFFSQGYWTYCMKKLASKIQSIILAKTDRHNDDNGKDIEQELNEAMDEIFAQPLDHYIGDTHLPGNQKITWSVDEGLSMVQGKAAENDTVELDIRPRARLAKLLAECNKLMEQDWDAETKKALREFSEQMSIVVGTLSSATSGDSSKYMNVVSSIIRKHTPSPELISKLLNIIHRSVALKVELIEAELQQY